MLGYMPTMPNEPLEKRKLTITPSFEDGMTVNIIPIKNRFEFEGWNLEVSDGYHTMHELYQHRMALTRALFVNMKRQYVVYKSKLHYDGTMFEGYFIVIMFTEFGQISYHYDLKHWDSFDLSEEPKVHQPFDGHGSLQVLERLMKL